MSRYKPYPKYKESGVEWLGEVPEHWEVRKLSAYGYFIGGSGFPNEYQGKKEGEYPFFKVSDTNIKGNEVFLLKSENYISRKIAILLNATIAPKNGIMFPKVGAALLGNKRRILSQPSITDNNTMVYVVYAGNIKYWYYWLSILDFGKISNPGPVPSVNESQLRLFPSIKPSIEEQTTIANFLDRETAKIDTLIEKQERLIELLAEKRQALISHAVTKGLDPNVKMKDSGVEWLGEVPEHWEVVQSRRLFSQRKERAKEGDEQLTASQKYGIISQKEFMEIEGRRVTQVLTGSEILKHVEPNDFVISMRSFQGGLEYCGISGCMSSAYIALIPLKHINARFFTYLFKSKPYIQALQSTSNLVRDGQALRFENFSLVDLVIVPDEEQKQIADYLDTQTKKIDTLTEKAKQAIALLKERRTVLISAAVTGKIDVREDAVKCK